MFCTHRSSTLKEAKVGCNAVFDLHHLFKALLLTESLSEQLREPLFVQMRLRWGDQRWKKEKTDAARKQDERRGKVNNEIQKCAGLRAYFRLV